MENKMTQEMIEKAKEAQSAEEILTLAKENEIELTLEEAKAYYEQFHKTGELSDDELDNVAGGGCHSKDSRLVVSPEVLCTLWKCKKCGGTKNILDDLHRRCTKCETIARCENCSYHTIEKGLWLCNREENRH